MSIPANFFFLSEVLPFMLIVLFCLVNVWTYWPFVQYLFAFVNMYIAFSNCFTFSLIEGSFVYWNITNFCSAHKLLQRIGWSERDGIPPARQEPERGLHVSVSALPVHCPHCPQRSGENRPQVSYAILSETINHPPLFGPNWRQSVREAKQKLKVWFSQPWSQCYLKISPRHK